jgi:glycosyltransferase involved in cell wall biosynthesis
MHAEKETRVAVVYHSVALYREAIFRKLFGSNTDPEYTLFSGTTSNQATLKLVSPDIAHKTLDSGGWRWIIVRNFWIGQILIQPRILLLPFQRKWDCVIFLGNAYYLTTWLSAALCRLTGKRVLMWTHGYRSEKTGWTAIIKNSFFRLAHGLILYGEGGKAAMRKQGFSENRLYVAYNCLDHEAHLALRQRFASSGRIAIEQFGNELPVIIWAGRFERGKDLPVLIRALAELRKRGNPVNALLIGNGPERAIIEKMSKDMALSDCVRLPGPIYEQEELARLLMGSDLAVSPGPVGLFAIHAQTFGLPVVTCDDWERQGPEAESVKEGVTGSFFKSGDASSLASSIAYWLGREQERDALREACYQQVDQFYTPAAVEKIITLAVSGNSP